MLFRSWLIPHFNATIDLLHEYKAAPMQPGGFFDVPKVSIIWAATCIADNPRLPKLAPHPDDTEGMKFLLERRTDFGGNGWEALFPGQGGRIVVNRVEGAHHFSMMVSSFFRLFLVLGMCVVYIYLPLDGCLQPAYLDVLVDQVRSLTNQGISILLQREPYSQQLAEFLRKAMA